MFDMNELKRDLPKLTTIQRTAHLVRYPNSCHVIQFLHDSEKVTLCHDGSRKAGEDIQAIGEDLNRFSL